MLATLRFAGRVVFFVLVAIVISMRFQQQALLRFVKRMPL